MGEAILEAASLRSSRAVGEVGGEGGRLGDNRSGGGCAGSGNESAASPERWLVPCNTARKALAFESLGGASSGSLAANRKASPRADAVVKQQQQQARRIQASITSRKSLLRLSKLS